MRFRHGFPASGERLRFHQLNRIRWDFMRVEIAVRFLRPFDIGSEGSPEVSTQDLCLLRFLHATTVSLGHRVKLFILFHPFGSGIPTLKRQSFNALKVLSARKHTSGVTSLRNGRVCIKLSGICRRLLASRANFRVGEHEMWVAEKKGLHSKCLSSVSAPFAMQILGRVRATVRFPRLKGKCR